MAQTHKSIILQRGIADGKAVGMAIDWPPEHGTYSNLASKIAEDPWAEEFADDFGEIAWEAEHNGRQFSPFEHLAAWLNQKSQTAPYDPWDVYDDGLSRGYDLAWEERSQRGY